MKAKKISPIPMESILNSRCNIRDEMTLGVSEEDYTELLDQCDIDDWQVDEVLKRAVILAPVDAFDKTITPVIWEDEND